MVSTFSTRKRLEKQNPGENSNTWGGYLNSNMIDLVDECFGIVCVAMTTAGDSTLSTANGSTDQGRRSQIILTGAPTSNVSLFVPAVQSFYLVRNKMTGSFKVTLKNTGGSQGVDFSGTGSGAEQGVVLSDGTYVREVSRTTSIGAFTAFTSAVIAVVSNATTDTTGGAVADFIPFLDASETGALNKVTVQKFLDNTYLNVTAKTTIGLTDGVYLYDADAAAMKSATTANLFKGWQSTAAKSVLVSADIVPVLDSAATNTAKRTTVDGLAHDILRLYGATQAMQELGSNTSVAVTPGVQQYHQSSAKAWVTFTGAGTVSIAGSYNVSSISDNAVGSWTINFTNAFSSTGYTGIGWARETLGNVTRDASVIGAFPSDTKTASSFQIRAWSGEADSAVDSSEVNMVFFGDQ